MRPTLPAGAGGRFDAVCRERRGALGHRRRELGGRDDGAAATEAPHEAAQPERVGGAQGDASGDPSGAVSTDSTG